MIKLFEETEAPDRDELNRFVQLADFQKKIKHLLKKKPLDDIDYYDMDEIKSIISSEPYEDLSNLEEPLCKKKVFDLVSSAMERTDEAVGFKLNRFSEFYKNMDGIQNGMWLFGGNPNAGKTTFISNLFIDILESNDDSYGIFFSLDDDEDIVYNRFFAIAGEGGLFLNDYLRPMKILDQEYSFYDADSRFVRKTGAEIFNKAMTKINEFADDRFSIFDIAKTPSIKEVKHHIIRTMKAKKDKKLFIMIDGLANLDFDGASAKKIREANIQRANLIKAMASTFKIPIFCTVELRKEENNGAYREPSMHSINETGKFAYNANFVGLLCFNDTKDIQTNEIVVKLKYAKNKLSSYRGNQFIKFKRGNGYMSEIENQVGAATYIDLCGTNNVKKGFGG